MYLDFAHSGPCKLYDLEKCDDIDDPESCVVLESKPRLPCPIYRCEVCSTEILLDSRSKADLKYLSSSFNVANLWLWQV